MRLHATSARALIFICALALGACEVVSKNSEAYRAQVFESCVPCHGERGEGNEELGAPRIAGLPIWYVRTELRKFRDGVRGAHPDDLEGARMAPMARALITDENLTLIAEYVGSLPPINAAPTLQGGDAARGKMYFAPCVTCHGDRAQGNVEQRAPPLAGASDWYLLRQLQKFRSGIRGKHPNDYAGSQMQPFSLTLADEQAMKDVIAYIKTLSN